MTDRNDLDSQIYRTFVGCGVADEKTPRASSGDELEQLLKQNHRYIFSLIHKFNQDINPAQPYSRRDDIIVNLRRGAPHAGWQTRAQHAAGAAKRGVHRLHWHAALQARQPHQAHLRHVRLSL